MKDSQLLVRTAVSLILDYFRWTQLVPMILVWSFVVAGSFLLLFAYNEEAAWSLLDLGIRIVQSIPFVGDRFTLWMESQTVNGTFSPDLGAVDWKALALKSWALLSLAFMVAGFIFRRLVGPLPPFKLSHKLSLAAAASTLVVLGLMILMYIDRGGQFEAFFHSLGLAGLNGLALFLISAWCLSISHVLGLLSQAAMKTDIEMSSSQPNP